MKAPTIRLNPAAKNMDDFKFSDIELVGYECPPHIKMNSLGEMFSIKEYTSIKCIEVSSFGNN